MKAKFKVGDRVTWQVASATHEGFTHVVGATIKRVVPLAKFDWPGAPTNPVQLYEVRTDRSLMRRKRFTYTARENELTPEAR